MVRHTLVSVRDLVATAGPFLLLALLLLIVAYWLLDPSPPRRMVMATGAERGAYAEFGARYAKLMAHNGIKVELRNTQGAVENLALLRDPNSGVDVAFVQGGVDSRPQASDDSRRRRPDVAGQPVLRAGVAVLPRRRRAAAAEVAAR